MKGARAEEKYLLLDVLSGCVVKSCMSVTFFYVEFGGVLRNEEDL